MFIYRGLWKCNRSNLKLIKNGCLHLICSIASQVNFLSGAPDGVICLFRILYFTVFCHFLSSLKTCKRYFGWLVIGRTAYTIVYNTGIMCQWSSYSTKAWSLSSTPSKPRSSSDTSSLYLGARFDTRSLFTWLCPIHALLATLLANLQLWLDTDRSPSLESRQSTCRDRAMDHLVCDADISFLWKKEEIWKQFEWQNDYWKVSLLSQVSLSSLVKTLHLICLLILLRMCSTNSWMDVLLQSKHGSHNINSTWCCHLPVWRWSYCLHLNWTMEAGKRKYPPLHKSLNIFQDSSMNK